MPVISSSKRSWKGVPSNVPKQFILDSMLFNSFVNQGGGKESVLSSFSDRIKLERVVGTTKGCIVVQRDFDRLEKWSDGSSWVPRIILDSPSCVFTALLAMILGNLL